MSGRRDGAGRRGGGLLLGLLVLPVVLAGCGGDEPAAPQAPATAGPGVGTVTTAADGVQEITLQTQDDYVFTPDTFTVDPGTVRLTVVNVAEGDDAQLPVHPRRGPGADRRRRSTCSHRGAGGDHRVRGRRARRLSLRVHASTSSWARSAP